MATDYIRREEALACFTDWIDRYGHEHSADEMIEYQRIEDLPAADVVEVVRCRECIHSTDHDCPISWGKTDEDFCSFAERRDGEDGKEE